MSASALEDVYCAKNYAPLPVELARGEGVFLYDSDGKRYYDFLSAYSAVSQGHCHPEIIAALTQQAERLTLTSRAFYNDALGEFAAYITAHFGYDQVLPMNTGAEAVETAIKIVRKWGYERKKVPENKAKVVVCEQNFHGRTTTVISFSSSAEATRHFGPYMPGFERIPFDNVAALEQALEDPNVVAFLVEPVQGEAGIKMPAEDYLQQARKLCTEQNVLLIIDEIQTGLGRMAALLGSCGDCSCEDACQRQRQKTYVRADVLLLGKALSGGVYPVSAVLADAKVMDVITPGIHGSTYGGNPVAARVSIAALEVLRKEKLVQRARRLGLRFKALMQALIDSSSLLVETRGRGLLNAIDINPDLPDDTTWRFCLVLRDNGLLAKPTHGNIIRMAPPLIITDEQLEESCDIIAQTVQQFVAKHG